MKTKTLAQAIGEACVARRNCLDSCNQEWQDRWDTVIDQLAKALPSGSGIDCGTKIVRLECTDQRIVLRCAFHHMNDDGYYDGWTEHTITATPTFGTGVNVEVSGPNRNDVHDYLAEIYDQALAADAPTITP